MKMLSQWVTQVARFSQPYHQGLKILERFSQGMHRLTSFAQAVVLLAVLLFGAVLIAPATPAYAQDTRLTPQQVVEYALTL
ncbi:MAG TPA: hypothetical protein V6D03_02800, partial [Candidatus Caenarcaniphilales bacterium]